MLSVLSLSLFVGSGLASTITEYSQNLTEALLVIPLIVSLLLVISHDPVAINHDWANAGLPPIMIGLPFLLSVIERMVNLWRDRNGLSEDIRIRIFPFEVTEVLKTLVDCLTLCFLTHDRQIVALFIAVLYYVIRGDWLETTSLSERLLAFLNQDF